MKFVGVDGYRKGWVCFWIDTTGKRGFELICDLKYLTTFDAERILIDIPIGLPCNDYRACDLVARDMLGKARSRVFLGARRGLLQHMNSFSAANVWAKKNGKGISQQMFHILPKIKQVDDFVTPAQQRTVREMHPERVFLRLNKLAWIDSKKTNAGLNGRRQLLAEEAFSQLDSWRISLRGTGVKEDDLFDACAGALAAQNPARVNAKTQKDARGLKMDIWY